MPAGLGVGQLWGLVRETHSLDQRRGPIAVSGPGAERLAARLTAGGDESAVRVGAEPALAAASVVVLAAAPGAEEREAMRRAARSGAPLVVVRAGAFGGPVPYALPSDVIDTVGDDIPLDRVVDVLASVLDDEDGVALAARLPALREAVKRRVIGRTALANAAIAGAPWLKQAHLPVLSLAQGRMLLRLGVAEGATLPHNPQQLAAAAAPSLGGALVAGLGLRSLYRRLPWRGPLVAAFLAYAGTRSLGELRTRLPS